MSGCSCIYVGDTTMPTFQKQKEVRARTHHYCDECGRKIAKGEQYEYVAGKWEGDFNTYKTCEDCQSVRGELFCDGWIYGALWEDVGEHIRHVGDAVLSCDVQSLTKVARDRLLDMVEEDWDE